MEEPKRNKILIIDDMPIHVQLLTNYLSSIAYNVIDAQDRSDVFEKLATHNPDIIIVKAMMAELDSFETCRILKSNDRTRYVPIIMVTALDEIEDKVKGIEAGVDDFISVPFNKLELLVRVKSLLRIKRLHEQLWEKVYQIEQAKERLRELAITDGLTGIYNYRYFKRFLTQELTRAHRHDIKVSLAMIDIDNFKNYNDANGHQAGAAVLIKISELILQCIRKIDLVTHYGGDEFVVVLPGTGKSKTIEIAEKIRNVINGYIFTHKKHQVNCNVTVSIGIATYPEDAKDSDQLIKYADDLLYKAKATGKNKLSFNSFAKQTTG